jgi:hypothetical protein
MDIRWSIAPKAEFTKKLRCCGNKDKHVAVRSGEGNGAME